MLARTRLIFIERIITTVVGKGIVLQLKAFECLLKIHLVHNWFNWMTAVLDALDVLDIKSPSASTFQADVCGLIIAHGLGAVCETVLPWIWVVLTYNVRL